MTATLSDEEGDSQSSPTEGRAGEEVNIRSKVRSPWTKALPTESPGPSEVVDGVVSITIPDEILSDPDPLWRCYAVGYFIGDAPHVGTIHATVNRIWSSPKQGSKIDVQFLEKNTVLFRIENPQMRARVTQRRYWHIADVPLVMNEWSPETALKPPDLSALPMWIDLKGVPSLMFSYKGLKCLSRAAGKFVKLHPNTEKCTRLDVVGKKVLIDVSYPWMPPKCNVCNSWGHKGESCTSKRVQILQKDKEIEEVAKSVGMEVNAQDNVICELNPKRNIVSEMLLELEGLPPALGCDVVGDPSRKDFETEISTIFPPPPPPPVKDSRDEKVSNGESLGDKEIVISPSRFSVLANEDIDEAEEIEEDEVEEGEVIGEKHKLDVRQKEASKNARLRLGSSFKLIKRIWDSTQAIHHSRSALSKFHAKLKMLKYEMPAAAASDRWNKLASIEEKFFRQKSCVRWLGAGDQNTVFFHRAVQTRSSRNTIKSLVNEAGETLTKLSDIKKEAVQHFQQFLQVQDQ
ncbi:hypothetical protein HID58_043940, partial [Brassica napus]